MPRGLLEPGQALPLPLEDREQRRVERVGRLEPFPGGVGVEVADHLLVVLDPFGVGRGGLLRRRPEGRTSRRAGGG